MKRRYFGLIVVVMCLSLLAGCTKKKDAETTGSQDMKTADNETKIAESQNDYRPVDPNELSFELKGFYSRSVVGEGGVPKTVGGEVEELICEGKTIGLVSNEFDGEFLETKEYGKIKIQFSNSLMSSGFSVWLTPKQKESLIKAIKN